MRIAVTVGQGMRVVERGVLETWLNLQGDQFEHFVGEVCGWGVDDTGAKGKGAVVRIPVNKENEAKGTVVRENVHFDRESCLECLLFSKSKRAEFGRGRRIANDGAEFARIVRRAYEQPA